MVDIGLCKKKKTLIRQLTNGCEREGVWEIDKMSEEEEEIQVSNTGMSKSKA